MNPNNICDIPIVTQNFIIKRFYSDTNNEEVVFKNNISITHDDFVDDIINKIALNYGVDSNGITLFCSSGSLVYDFKFKEDTKLFNYNPFIGFKEFVERNFVSPFVMNNDALDFKYTNFTQLHNKCIHNLKIKENELYCVYIDDLIKYCKNNINDKLVFARGFLVQYFKSDLVNKYSVQIKNTSSDFMKYNEMHKAKISMQNSVENTEISKSIQLGECSITSVRIVVNENENKEFINLLKIFNYLSTTEEVPFISYYLEHSSKESESKNKLKIVNSVTNLVSKDVIKAWIEEYKMSLNEKSKIKKNVTLKLFVSKDVYANVIIFKNGRIHMECDFNEDGITLDIIMNQVEKMARIIKYLNKYNYLTVNYSDMNSSKKIMVPDAQAMKENYYNDTESNTVLVKMTLKNKLKEL